jgi:amidohydrolase
MAATSAPTPRARADEPEEALASVLPAVVATATAFRHAAHADPELGFQEVRTLARVREALAAAGIVGGTVMAQTGLIVDIDGTGPPAADGARPRRVAFRADMDALRMTEAENGLPYRSRNEHAAHMCGHDGHMAALVGAAALIARARARLPTGTSVRLLFQPAEEGPGGAPPMIAAGCLNGVDEARARAYGWPNGRRAR